MQSLNIGDTAPDFSLLNQKNEQISLANYKGKYIILYFYPKDDTPGCTAEGCLFRDFNKEIEEAGGKVLGISADTVESHKKFSSKFEFNFDILSDPEHKVAEKYNTWVKKNMFGKIFLGIQRSTFLIGPDGTILKIWKKADPKTNAKEAYEEIMKVKNS